MDIYVYILYREWGYGDYVVIMGLVGILWRGDVIHFTDIGYFYMAFMTEHIYYLKMGKQKPL